MSSGQSSRRTSLESHFSEHANDQLEQRSQSPVENTPINPVFERRTLYALSFPTTSFPKSFFSLIGERSIYNFFQSLLLCTHSPSLVKITLKVLAYSVQTMSLYVLDFSLSHCIKWLFCSKDLSVDHRFLFVNIFFYLTFVSCVAFHFVQSLGIASQCMGKIAATLEFGREESGGTNVAPNGLFPPRLLVGQHGLCK